MPARPSPRSTEDACATFHAALQAVVDGEADALSVARTESHAAGCDPCRRHLMSARAYRRLTRQVGDGERAPEALRERVMASMRGMRGSATS